MKVPRLWDSIDHISPKAVSDGARVLPVGAVLIVIRGMILAHSFPVARAERPLAFNQDMKAVVTRPDVDSNFLLYWLTSNGQRLLSLTTESTHGTKRLPSESLFRETLHRPPFDEQRAIAAALSDVDALLAKLDQLIAKKRNLKQAAMQQLLTCQTRLPGFCGLWPTVRLGAIGQFSKGRGLSKDALSEFGALPAIPYTAIFTDFNEVVHEAEIRNYVAAQQRAEVVIDGPCLLIASSSNMLANIGKATAFLGVQRMAVGGDVLIYQTAADVRFLSYLLSTEGHRRQVVALSQGSTIRHVYASTFSAYEVNLPSLAEQTAIATILSNIDAELTALAARRDKTRALKQGMMQELLTGRIRLV